MKEGDGDVLVEVMLYFYGQWYCGAVAGEEGEGRNWNFLARGQKRDSFVGTSAYLPLP
jgi:hypothetical protein